jgi:hypothetical protein
MHRIVTPVASGKPRFSANLKQRGSIEDGRQSLPTFLDPRQQDFLLAQKIHGDDGIDYVH